MMIRPPKISRTRNVEFPNGAARSYSSGVAMSTKPLSARIHPNTEINTAATLDQYW